MRALSCICHRRGAISITVVSYQDGVDFGLVADREQMPDLAELVASLEQAMSELSEAARTPRWPAVLA